MLELIKKELTGFFTSLSGYIILAFFLIATGTFLWMVPGEYNILESGMADLQPFFSLAPVLYLFLVPLLCMRLFAEERRGGTLELLFTRPVSVSCIVSAKYIAGFLLVLLSLLPTFIYPVSLWFLAQPVGNIDMGGIIGSYIGVMLLSAVYVSAGVWASSRTDNQIVAFLYGMAIAFLLYAGFDYMAALPVFADYQNLLLSLGFQYHYEPMSRGVIAFNDVVYFLSVIAFFLFLTIRKFHGTCWRWYYILPLLLVLNMIASHFYRKIDITDDRRYTLSENTRDLLQNLDKTITVDIFLGGKLPVGMQRLQYSTTRMLEEFNRIIGGKLRYNIIDPAAVTDKEEKKAMVKYLAERGIMPVNLNRKSDDETLSQQIIFPGLVMYDDSTEVSVNLLQNIAGLDGNENIHSSVEALEYELTNALRLITRKEKKAVAFLTGHNELPYEQLTNIAQTLLYYYQVDFVSADTLATDLAYYDALIIAKPTTDIPEHDKYIIDQYAMNGGSILWCIDEVEVNHEALKEQESTIASYRPLNVEDMLFKYGVRINPELLLDGNCVLIPVVAGMNGTTPDFRPAPWYYSPLLLPRKNNPVTAGIQPVRVDYANSIDTVGDGNDELRKTVLLASSQYSAALKTPCPVSLSITGEKMDSRMFNRSHLPVAVLVEGQFPSLYRYNRPQNANLSMAFKPQSTPTRMIFIADGDVLRNGVRGVGENTEILPLGYDEYSGQMYGNRDFILNCVNTLCDDEGWMQLRGRNLSIYLLNKTLLKSDRSFWKWLNLYLPLLLVFGGGSLFYTIHRYRNKK